MTKTEKIIVSAYTGYLMCDFADLHEYIEQKLGRSVQTLELAFENTRKEIHDATRDDFHAVIEGKYEKHEDKTIEGYNPGYLAIFAWACREAGIRDEDLADFVHNGEAVAKILRDDLERQLDRVMKDIMEAPNELET